ncbi:protein starmaker-like [Ctenocephalides felis]|uniref:protein starmaker-like n=1 Tax=Ctenocephalides felis TaxID=7515 RepID=UPI000E6E55AE|nr:protein starmaker-like [Ctenocephalides felis]
MVLSQDSDPSHAVKSNLPVSVVEYCENGLNSAECLRNEISKLRLDLRPVTAHLPANTKQYLPFGSLESDWNRLLQLESLLPEDHHLRQQLTRSFLLLVQAVREALEYQLSKTTTIRSQSDDAVTTKYQPTTDAPEFQSENEISEDEYEVIVDSKTTPKIINDNFEEDVDVANGKEDFEAKAQDEENFNKSNEAIELHDKSDEGDKDTMDKIIVTEEKKYAGQSGEKEVSVKALDSNVDSKEKTIIEEEISNGNNEKAEVGEESGKGNKDSVKTIIVASEEDSSSESGEKKLSVRKLDTIINSSEENSESVGDFNLAKAEGLVGEDMREKDKDHESDENSSQNFDHEEKKDGPEQHTDPENSVESVNDDVHQTTILTTSEDLSEMNAGINFPVINQDEIIENLPKDQDELDETPIETTETDLETDKEKESLSNLEHGEIMTTESAHTTTEKSKEMIIENTKNLQNEDIETITDSAIDENETTIDEELHDIVYPGVDSTTEYEPPVIFTDTTIGISNTEQLESRDELQTEEHIPHTLENVDVFGPEIQYTTDENGHTDLHLLYLIKWQDTQHAIIW